MNRTDYLIWWTDPADANAIGDRELDDMPEYIRSEFESRVGRNGRGRLWVDDWLGLPESFGLVWSDEKVAARAIDLGSHAGIVIRSIDRHMVACLPGMITDLELDIA